MANGIDQDQQWLLSCLTATLDPNPEVRNFAETSLSHASLQPGFGGALSRVAANRELSLGLRQLAAVLLKQFIRKHWEEDDDVTVSVEEKEVIRKHLLASVDDSHRKICTAISMAIASIGAYDWPENWPELLPSLLRLINDRSNMNGVQGALRCLALLSADLDDTVVPTLIPVLFPSLHTIVSSSQDFNKYLRSKALSVVYSCVSVIGVMRGVYRTETTALMTPMVKPWMDQFAIILGQPVQPEDPDDWSMRMEVLKCLSQFVQNFPALAEGEFMVVVEPLWQTFVTSLGVYIRSSIDGAEDSFEGNYDSDGAEKGLDSFVIQLFEFLLTIVGNARLQKVVLSNINQLVYHTVAFLQITEQQIHTWSTDANQFVADEDDVTYSCRVSGTLLLEEVMASCGVDGINAIIDASRQRFSESQQQKAAGSAVWWRIREAALFALASVSDQLLEAEGSGTTKIGLGNLIESIVAEDIRIGPHEYPFLCARVFMLVAKFSSVIGHVVLEQFLYAAMKTVGMDVPPPVKVGACQALSQLLPEANKGIVQSQLIGLLSSLADLLQQASDETLHLVLETMQAAIKAGHEILVAIEPTISAMILNVWASHISDPFIGIDAIEVLEAIKNSPGCIHPLVSRVQPHIGPILNKPREQPEGLVAGSLDLVTMLLKNAPVDVVKVLYDVCFDAVTRIVLQSDDHSELQNATQCLAAFIYGGRQEVLAWAADSGFAMRSLLDVASRLLDPSLESSGSLFVGNYILQLILHLPQQMAQHTPDLIAALVRRMQSAQIAGLRSSLIVLFARLVHMSAPNVEQFINMLVNIPADGHDNAFAYVMSEWTKQQGEIQGAYQIKVTTTALTLLLSTRHSQLGNVNVQGHIQTTEGITTRSKAKVTPEKWTMVPLPFKIVSLLADTLLEMREQVQLGDEENEWEEIEEDDEEGDKDLLYSTATVSSGRATYDELEAMAKAFDGDQEDEDDDELLSAGDPLNQINVASYLGDFLTKLWAGDRPLFDHLCQNLRRDQVEALQTVVSVHR
ncbi:Ipo9 [Linum perenne]